MWKKKKTLQFMSISVGVRDLSIVLDKFKYHDIITVQAQSAWEKKSYNKPLDLFTINSSYFIFIFISYTFSSSLDVISIAGAIAAT